MAKKKNGKKTAAKTQLPAKPSNSLFKQIIIAAGVSLAAAILSLVYLGLFERGEINSRSLNTQAQLLADNQASLVNQALQQLQSRLDASAASPTLQKVLNSGNDTNIEQQKAILSSQFPEALSTRLIPLGPLGIAKVSRKTHGLRNEIEMSLIRQASNGERAEPEAYKVDKQWLFSLVAPVIAEDKQKIKGALLITLNDQYLLTLLKQLDNSQGQTTLVQQFQQKQHTLVTTGAAGSNSIQISSDTRVSNWKIVFAPSAEFSNSTSYSALMVWVVLAVIALTIAITAFICLQGIGKALATNLQQLLDNPTDEPFTLPGFNEVAQRISQPVEKAAARQADTQQKDKEPEAEPEPAKPADEGMQLPTTIPDTIFRAYDIRGLAEEQLTDELVYAIGLAIGSEALDQGQQTLVVCADGRHSSPRIRDAMIKGLLESGRDVIDIGMLPTPLMYFATHQLGAQSGVMITGSHNPANYNGIKIVIGGRALSGGAITALKQRILSKELATGKGQLQTQEIEQDYIDYIINDVAIAQPLKIVLDAGNGVTGAIAPRLFEELGCEVIPLFCEVDGNFPNHHPDPSVESNLNDLINAVRDQGADLGIAFDGDGDRVGVVTANGNIVPADRLLMLFAQDVVSRNPGADVLFDVKCTRHLNTLISNYGGRPIMWKTGHSFMKEKMQETGALLGGEFSGHIFFKERWFGFDDGMYAAARLVEILSTTDPDLDLQLEAFPTSIGSPELKVEADDENKFTIIENLIQQGQFGDGKISTLDGVRVDYPDGWGLVRASNTTPTLILRFEAETDDAMTRIKALFKEQLEHIDSNLQFGF